MGFNTYLTCIQQEIIFYTAPANHYFILLFLSGAHEVKDGMHSDSECHSILRKKRAWDYFTNLCVDKRTVPLPLVRQIWETVIGQF